MRFLPLAVLAVLLAEIVVFIGLGELIGLSPAVLAVLAATVSGLVLVRREGLRAWRGFREATAAGAPPGAQVTDGMVGLGAALLLAAPGLLTGLAGLTVLAPPVRRLARRRVQAAVERRMSLAEAGDVFGPHRVRAQRAPSPREGTVGDVVEGEVIDPDGGPGRTS